MIRHITLENWRAYRNLDIDVEPGTTFLVAPNGVGKSSLLEAVRWALAAGNVAPRPSMVRQGHPAAAVAVTLGLAGGGALVLRRSLRAKGARLTTEVSATLDGVEVSEERAVALLEESWAADARFVSRTAFLTEDLRRDAEDPNLRSHLCRAYSLDDLQAAMAEIEPVLAQLSKGLKTARAELTGTQDQLQTAEAELVGLSAAVVVAGAAVEAAREAHAAARVALDKARAGAAQQASAAAWREGEQRILTVAGSLVGEVDPEASAADVLASLEVSLGTDLDEIRRQQASLQARLEAAETALASLHEAGAACPTCLRALDDASRAQAEQAHQSTLETARAGLAGVDDTALATAVDAVRQLSRQAAALGPPPPAAAAEAEAADVESLVEAEAAVLTVLEAAAAGLREAELQVESMTALVDAIRSDLSAADALTEQYRTEGLLLAARTALDETITTVLSRQLQPVAAEVNRRWEAVFPDRPNLRVLPDGQMSRVIDGVPLEFGAFSAGEQTVAKLMMRLTTLLTTTTVPFCWIDEPLEHLDPVSRQLVASTLAHLTAPGGLEQIFVTTYEEPLARRLAELQPGRVRVQYLRTAPVR